MDKAQIYVGLDIGTTAIRVIVGEAVNDKLNIIGIGSERSRGLKNGVIVDIDKVVTATRKAVHQAQTKANIKFDQVVVGIPAKDLVIEPVKGMTIVADQPKEITAVEVRKVAAAALSRNLPPEREVVAIVPKQFIVDGQKHIVDPRGMSAVRIELEAICYSVPSIVVNNIRKVLERAGLKLKHFVLNPLGLAHIALNDGEQDFGTVLIDMGGSQSTAYVIRDHDLKFVAADDEGGQNLTKDVSVVLNTSLGSAEKLKRNYGVADPEATSVTEKFPVEIVGKDDPMMVDETYLSEILEARFEQIFDRLLKQLDSAKALDLPGGVVLTGGVAETMSITSLASDLLGQKVRIFAPREMGLRNASFATILGIVSYAADLSEIDLLVTSVINKDALAALNSQQPVTASEQVEQRSQVGDSNPNGGFFNNLKSLFNGDVEDDEQDSQDSSSTQAQQSTEKPQNNVRPAQKSSESQENKPESESKIRNFFNKFFD
ncbi:cell division protein FtsA [Lapidilactobacillus dextrinicus]|uniref:cell division protein FtsA n=1 Tax=Lapidilactobacillus dextrinicus TaxID=51664 RepID=UPI000709BDB7|nr:cell division protein FtsA [Lapidilactobacillus dextrinicus]QFG47310.1 cell division protein FtsA [Lapidilactobacillus dextrinicus]